MSNRSVPPTTQEPREQRATQVSLGTTNGDQGPGQTEINDSPQ